MRRAAAAKINLALVVGPRRRDGNHELVTVYQRIALADRIEVHESQATRVTGFLDDTLVRRALDLVAEKTDRRFSAHIDKRIPVATGLAGGSADAATALLLANDMLPNPLAQTELQTIARNLGADVPFFLRNGPHLGAGDGTELRPLDLPQDYWIVIVLPNEARKTSTADVYRQFDNRHGGRAFAERTSALLTALERIRRPRDLATLPPNDLASSPLADELRALGAFRADVTGAGPAVYGLFVHRVTAAEAQRRLRRRGRTWVTAPAWYV